MNNYHNLVLSALLRLKLFLPLIHTNIRPFHGFLQVTVLRRIKSRIPRCDRHSDIRSIVTLHLKIGDPLFHLPALLHESLFGQVLRDKFVHISFKLGRSTTVTASMQPKYPKQMYRAFINHPESPSPAASYPLSACTYEADRPAYRYPDRDDGSCDACYDTGSRPP